MCNSKQVGPGIRSHFHPQPKPPKHILYNRIKLIYKRELGTSFLEVCHHSRLKLKVRCRLNCEISNSSSEFVNSQAVVKKIDSQY